MYPYSNPKRPIKPPVLCKVEKDVESLGLAMIAERICQLENCRREAINELQTTKFSSRFDDIIDSIKRWNYAILELRALSDQFKASLPASFKTPQTNIKD